MKTTSPFTISLATLFSLCLSAASAEPGFTSLFNGKDLTGWAGRPEHWSVEDDAITGRTTQEQPAKGNNFLIAKEGDKNLVVDDFELRLSYRIIPNNDKGFANSGIQYRSKDFGNFVVGGYQADMEAGRTYSGILYEERMDGILAQRGQKTVVKTVGGKTKVEVVGSLGKSEDIQAKIKDKDWNDYVVIAQGNHLQHFIDGVQTVDVVDEREGGKAAKSGILALQLHAGDPMTVQFRDIRLKKLSSGASKRSDLELFQGEWRAVEVVANGKPIEEEALAAIKVIFTGNEYSFEGKKNSGQGSFKLSESEDPKKMDVTQSTGKEFPAIYEISDNQFKTCYAVNGAARPTEFKSTEGSDHVFATYKRK